MKFVNLNRKSRECVIRPYIEQTQERIDSNYMNVMGFAQLFVDEVPTQIKEQMMIYLHSQLVIDL